jgi:hypothetical protein
MTCQWLITLITHYAVSNVDVEKLAREWPSTLLMIFICYQESLFSPSIAYDVSQLFDVALKANF